MRRLSELSSFYWGINQEAPKGHVTPYILGAQTFYKYEN